MHSTVPWIDNFEPVRKNVLITTDTESPLPTSLQSEVNEQIHVFDGSRFWSYNNDAGKFLKSHTCLKEHPEFDPLRARGLILAFYTCLTRWNEGFLSETNINCTIMAIQKIFIFLKEQNIDTVIFYTASPHHLASITLDIACEMAKLPRTYLYPVVFSDRVLPLTKSNSYTNTDYSYLSSPVSSFSAFDMLFRFRERASLNRPPETNQDINPSIYGALYILVMDTIASLWVKTLSPLVKSVFKLSAQQNNYTDFIIPKCLSSSSYRIPMITQISYSVRQIRYIYEYKNAVRRSQKKNNRLLHQKLILCIFAGLEPEATTAPEGGEYQSIASLLVAIRNKFPDTPILYKEHPNIFSLQHDKHLSMTGKFRNSKFMKLITSLDITPVDNDFLTKLPETSNFYPVTLTGTIGIERSLQGKRTIVAGRPYYGLAMPGILRFSDITLHDLHQDVNPTELAKQAFSYLHDLLDNKTIENPYGIGSGNPKPLTKSGIREYASLIKVLLS